MKKILKRGAVLGLISSILSLGLILPRGSEIRAETKPSLAVLPFLLDQGNDPSRGAVCPFCKGIYRRGAIAPGAQNTLARLLGQKVETLGTFNVLPLEKVEENLSQSERRHLQEKPVSSSLQLGKELNVDFIFVGFLYRDEERVGSAMGVDKPASVGFDVHLYRLRDGLLVWEGRFNETQKPLSDNLFQIGSFIRRKGSWLTSEELSSVGMDEMLKRLPGTKELEEKK